MSKIAIIYSTTDGQTKKIANVLKSNMDLDHSVEMVPFAEVHNLELQECEKIVVGASIRYGRHNPEVLRFIRKHRKILDEKLTFFFEVIFSCALVFDSALSPMSLFSLLT